MAIAVSQAFKDYWKRKVGARHTLRLRYKRAYYDASASPPAIVWESTWHDLHDKEIVEIGQIPNQLDLPFANIFRTAECVVKLDNIRNQWIESPSLPSIWAADELAQSGYQAYLTRVQIDFGYVFDSGVIEYCTLFTGVLIDTPKITGRGAHAELTIASMMHLAETSDAEEVSEDFTDEPTDPAAGDGTNTEFKTQSVGVDHLSKVEATNPDVSPEVFSVVAPADYALGDLATLLQTSISFVSSVKNGAEVRSSGRKWLTGFTIEAIVARLLQNAGFEPSEYSISNVLLPGGLSGRRSIDSQLEWNAGTLMQGVEADESPGDLLLKWLRIDDFADGNYSGNPEWEASTAGSYDASAGYLAVRVSAAAVPHLRLPFEEVEGTWRFRARAIGGDPAGGTGGLVTFMCQDPGPFGYGTSGYTLRIYTDGGIELRRLDPSTQVVLGSASLTTTDWVEYRITRSAAGEIKVYADGVLKITATDTEYTSSSYFAVGAIYRNPSGIDIDDIYFCHALDGTGAFPASNVYESAELDILSTPTALGRLTAWQTLNGGTISYETAFGATSGNLDAYVAIAADGQILSNPGRYFKVRITITRGPLYFTSPKITKVSLAFSVSTVNVSVANHAGKDGQQMLERYAQIADYEIGCNSAGKVFFRPKSVNTAYVVDLTQENAIIDVLGYDSGIKRICNAGKVRYNDHYSEYDKVSASEAEPTSETRFRRRAKSEDYSDIFLANDVDLASSRARLIYENNYLPKRQLKLKVWLIPWLELSDVVRISYFDHPLMRLMIAGDPLNRWGSNFLSAGAAQNVLARSWDMKVVEYHPFPSEPGQSLLTVEEILA